MGNPAPDPIFKASVPIPGEDVTGAKGNMSQAAMPSSPLFWGRNYVPPSPAEAMAARGPQPYPRAMYHQDGRIQSAGNETEHQEALANGWKETPELFHREMLQFGDQGKSGKRLATAGSADQVGVIMGREQPKWGTVALAVTTKVTDHHVSFLKSRGYTVANVKEAEAFVEKLNPEEAAQFFGDAAAWKKSPIAISA